MAWYAAVMVNLGLSTGKNNSAGCPQLPATSVVFDVGDKWNIVSVPLKVGNNFVGNLYQVLFPSIWLFN